MYIPITRIVVATLWSSLLILGVDRVSGQAYPTRPIRIVSAEVGGTSDFTARLIAQGISGPLRQQVITENRTSIIAKQIAAKAQPDGYTLYVAGPALWIEPLVQNRPYDLLTEFSPITWAVSLPHILVVHPSLPIMSVKELIALAKARPGELNYASGPTGTPIHLAAALFNAMAGIKITRINYKGTGPAFTALMGGQEVQLLFSGVGVAMPLVKAERLRALAITTAEPSALAPGLPTVASSLPGYRSETMAGVFVPAKTPAAIINRLNQEIVGFLNRADTKETLLKNGTEVVANSPQEFSVAIKSEIAKMGKVIKDAGINAD